MTAPTLKLPQVRAIAIGASAGAVEALLQLLPPIPAGFALPIFVVIHLPPDKKSALADLFATRCRIPVKEAEDKEIIQPGIYFAPPNYHLLVETDGSLSLSNEEPELFSRPSINALFESAADAYGGSLLAIVLTGANSDGARGLHTACEAGSLVVVQDPKSADCATMPRAALDACPRATVLALPEIGSLILQCGTPAAQSPSRAS